MDERGRFTIDLDSIDLQTGIRNAMRLLASTETADSEVRTHLHEVAVVTADMLEDLELDSLDDETVNALLDRVAQTILGLTVVAHGALEALARHGVDRLEFLKAIEDAQAED